MAATRLSLVLGIALSLAAPAAGAEPPGGLGGVWTASGRKFVITRTDSGWRAHGWGACSPAPCDWGETALELVAPTVGSHDYSHALAVWQSGFATTYAVFRFEPDAPMVVELFTIFKDHSPRSNWTLRLRLARDR